MIPERERLPRDRSAITRKLVIIGDDGADIDIYVTVGLYDDGRPGEVFIRVAKQGSALSGMAESVSILLSMALQHGTPLSALTGKLKGIAFEPAGMTRHDLEKRITVSIIDYVAHWLEQRFPGKP